MNPMRLQTRSLLPSLILCFCASVHAQTRPSSAPATEPGDFSSIEHRLDTLNSTLLQTQAALQQSMVEIQRLQEELNSLRSRASSASSEASSSSRDSDVQQLQEQQEVQQAEIKQHDQEKVGSDSKYPLKITGLLLFNAFSNAGVVDNAELPSVTLPRAEGSSHGALGGTLRQTVLGVQAVGPTVFGAHSSAFLNADFFGGTSTNDYGYISPAGSVRLRDAALTLDWRHTTLQAGNTEPIFSPRSPTSYAQVAMPALSSSGNLWAWSPQISLEQRLPLNGVHGLSLAGGLIVPQSPGYNSVQLDSPVEASRQPGVEGRLAYQSNQDSRVSPQSLTIGVSGYSAHQVYSSYTRIHSWAVTGDYQIPVTRLVTLSGEIYRGRSLGGFGGGTYKDILSGTDPVTGHATSIGVDTTGGWTQLKLKPNRLLEANAIFGVDQIFSSNFDSIVLPASANPAAYTARNSSVVGNLIFRPRASVIISPEYRRLLTWRYTGPPSIANLYTLSLGYQF